MSLLTLYKTNSQYLRLTALTDVKTGLAITDATVTATMYDASGNPIAQINGLAMPHIGNGTYEVEIPATFDPDPKLDYTVRCIAINPSNKRLDLTKSVRVMMRAQ